jgi:bifunctional DNA-binding transcriptional regulator/antitoxin component of YhaV-PrlF toxin-antitoxin module
VKRKVQKIGNLLGVVLPKEVVSRLKADEGDRLFLIEGPEGTYQLTAYDPGPKRKSRRLRISFGVTATHCACWRSEGNRSG